MSWFHVYEIHRTFVIVACRYIVRLVRPCPLVAGREHLAAADAVDAWPVRSSGRHAATVHADAQGAAHPAAWPSGVWPSHQLLCQRVQGRQQALQGTRWVFFFFVRLLLLFLSFHVVGIFFPLSSSAFLRSIFRWDPYSGNPPMLAVVILNSATSLLLVCLSHSVVFSDLSSFIKIILSLLLNNAELIIASHITHECKCIGSFSHS